MLSIVSLTGGQIASGEGSDEVADYPSDAIAEVQRQKGIGNANRPVAKADGKTRGSHASRKCRTAVTGPSGILGDISGDRLDPCRTADRQGVHGNSPSVGDIDMPAVGR
jgi:hypothetical protein